MTLGRNGHFSARASDVVGVGNGVMAGDAVASQGWALAVAARRSRAAPSSAGTRRSAVRRSVLAGSARLSGRRATAGANLVPIPPPQSNLFGSSFALRRLPQLEYRNGEGKALFGCVSGAG